MLVLFGGHGHPVPIILVCAALVVAPAVGTWLWWRRLRAACTSSLEARSAARREACLAAGAAAVLTTAFIFVSYVALWGEYVGVLGVSLSAGHVVAAVPLLALSLTYAVHILGERSWPTPTGRRREAGLVVRDPVTLLDRRAIRWCFGVLAAVVLGLALAASGARAVSKIQGYVAETITPFPGWLWAIPLLGAAGLAALLLRSAVRAVAERAAISGVSPEWDAWLRRQVVRRLAQTAIALCGLTTAGILTVAGSSLHLLGRGFGSLASGTPDDLHQVLGVALQALAMAVFAASLWSAIRLNRGVAPQPVSPTEPLATTTS